jgi:hypothetical protein
MSSSVLVFGGQLLCRCSVGQQESLVAENSPGGNGHIALAQTAEHFHLLTAGHNPKYAPRAIDRWIRQSHSTPAQIDSGDGYVLIGDIEYVVPRN